MKKCLFIVNRSFWPPNSGHEVVLYNYCKELHDSLGYNITLYLFNESQTQNPPDFIHEIIPSIKMNKIGKVFSIFKYWIKNRPLQNGLMINGQNKIKLENISKNNKYDLIIIDMIRLAEYINCFEDQNCKKILILEDLLSDRYKRILNTKGMKGSLMGYYQNTLPSIINSLLDHKGIKNYVLDYEAKAIEKEEDIFLKKYDFNTLIAEKDVNFINNKYKFSKSVRLACGVDVDYFGHYKRSIVNNGSKNMCFTGNMHVAANEDSVRMIAKYILPLVKHDFKFHIIGSYNNVFANEFVNDKRIVFHGRIDDFRPLVSTCNLFLAPIAYGTGIKTKIIEAMAMGIPVLTNSVGAESIDAQNYKEFICEDDYSKIAKNIDYIFDNKDEGELIGSNGQIFVKNKFDWKLVFEAFKRMGL